MSDKSKIETIKEEKKKKCGLIIPISAIDGCDEEHWRQVKKIIEETVNSCGIEFETRIVSEKTKTSLIQSNIVQAIYEDEIVICDVSGKNPNVMFELGMRIAFNKPVIIIYDNEGGYPFDIANIAYIKYPRDLHYYKVKSFQEELKNRILKMLEETENDFLKTFGKFTTYEFTSEKVKINENEGRILEAISDLKYGLEHIEMKIFKLENRTIRRSPEEMFLSRKLFEVYSVEKFRGISYEEFLERVQFNDNFRGINPSKLRKIVFDYWERNLCITPYELK